MSDSKSKDKNLDEVMSALDQFELTLEVMSEMVGSVKQNIVSEFEIENHIEDIAQFNLEQSISPQEIVH